MIQRRHTTESSQEQDVEENQPLTTQETPAESTPIHPPLQMMATPAVSFEMLKMILTLLKINIEKTSQIERIEIVESILRQHSLVNVLDISFLKFFISLSFLFCNF